MHTMVDDRRWIKPQDRRLHVIAQLFHGRVAKGGTSIEAREQRRVGDAHVFQVVNRFVT
jgi:hypothetical protein